ncbi:MAG TPA: helix-turn-helix domain-containing protein [Candidatus Sulfotelmatobacter sp.]|nr:helix-turn-helix domain-containing protein [Candidatus Sulfotelmatobacter sp.]
MPRRSVKSAAPSPCAIGELLEVLARPWTLHILWALSHEGPMRFGVLRRQVDGISSRVLTERLRTLEEKGFVFRDYQPTIPPAVTYGITERMKDIEKVLAQLEGLSRKWHGQPGGTHGGGVAAPASEAARKLKAVSKHEAEAVT